MTERVMISVTMEHVPTGEVRTYEADNYGPWAEGSEFWWSDGNMSCDCNRAMDFARAGGEENEDHGCGDGEFRIVGIKSQDGRLLYSEPPLIDLQPVPQGRYSPVAHIGDDAADREAGERNQP